jgi:hypothetical protein
MSKQLTALRLIDGQSSLNIKIKLSADIILERKKHLKPVHFKNNKITKSNIVFRSRPSFINGLH